MNPTWYSEEEVNKRAKEEALRLSDERIAAMASDRNEHFHLDKGIPISLVVTLGLIVIGFIGQTLTLVAVGTQWKTEIDGRVASLERENEDRKPQESRLIRVEEKLLNIVDSNKRIEEKLGELLTGSAKP